MQYEKLYSDLIADLRRTAEQHDRAASVRCIAGEADWIVDQQITRTIQRIAYRAEMAQEVPQ